MSSSLQIEADDSVLLRVTHSNIKSFSADVRLYLQMSVEAVKDKLWKKCGTYVHSMSLKLYDDSNAKLADLTQNLSGWLEDTSLVEKYTISDEAFAKRDGTFRKFKEKLASQNSSSLDSKISEDCMKDLCANVKVGDRCQVEPGEKRGIIKFVGQAETLSPGFWVGVQYDEPLGKHDGTVKGKRYFECPPLHGAMIRPDKIKVGDYPERDPFEEEEI